MNDERPKSRWLRASGAELVQDISGISAPTSGFLRRHRHRIKTVMEDGSRTDTYIVDFVDRERALRDAAAIAVYARTSEDPLKTEVLLRRQFRYGAYLVTGQPMTTEVIAGLIEGDEPLEACAVRELYEEACLSIEAAVVKRLGPPFFVLPGLSTERVFPLAVEVDRALLLAAPTKPLPGDGSPFEEGAELCTLPLDAALLACQREASADLEDVYVADAKTEVILLRLLSMLKGPRG